VETGAKPVRESIEFARIVAFTDGVFAIAITLLVLSLDVPSNVSGSALHDFLFDAWPQLFAYFLSFAVIGRFWIGHHRLFATVHDFDRRLMALNLAYLSLIVLIPFPTELLGEYGGETDAVVLYAVVVGSAALMAWVMLRYALHRGHARPDARAAVGLLSGGALLPAILFYASIPVAFASPVLAQVMWIGLLVEVFRRRF
jgi:uncharacterized membrane protein